MLFSLFNVFHMQLWSANDPLGLLKAFFEFLCVGGDGWPGDGLQSHFMSTPTYVEVENELRL